MGIKFEDLRDDYAHLWSTMSLRADWAQKAADAAKFGRPDNCAYPSLTRFRIGELLLRKAWRSIVECYIRLATALTETGAIR
jgi:hypothetical protein